MPWQRWRSFSTISSTTQIQLLRFTSGKKPSHVWCIVCGEASFRIASYFSVIVFVPNSLLLGSFLGKQELATLAGRGPELCVRALCPGLVLLLSSGHAGQPVSSSCPSHVLLFFSCPPCARSCPAIAPWPRWPTLCPPRVLQASMLKMANMPAPQ